MRGARLTAVLCLLCGSVYAFATSPDFEPVRHHQPDLIVDLGVGLWALPLPMDYDQDGDWDLVVSTTNKTSPGLYFFENKEGNVVDPVFEPAVRVGDAKANVTISHGPDGPIVCTPGQRHPQFRSKGLSQPKAIPYKPTFHADRDNQWKLVDVDQDGREDLVVGASDWREYGWDDAFNDQGHWTNGPIHGRVYWMRNEGTNESPRYAPANALQAGDADLDVFGAPSPCFADWDKDGDLDLVCGSFLDNLTYFENVGTSGAVAFGAGRPVLSQDSDGNVSPLQMELQMLQVVQVDWDQDGLMDLVIGQEDGRVAIARNTGQMRNRTPVFTTPTFFRQRADLVKCGALVTPYSVDWDADGDEDLICGNTAGFIEWIENLGGDPCRWAAPVRLEVDGSPFRVLAGENGSIQGPAEAKWGYTVVCVADWDHDGKLDILANSIWGKILSFSRASDDPRGIELTPPVAVEVNWPADPPKPEWNWWSPERGTLVTQWRTSPVIFDLNRDGRSDLLILDHEGCLAFFERTGEPGALQLQPGKRIFQSEDGTPLQLNLRRAGKSGRRKWTIVDWDGDGKLDLLVDSKSIDFWRNVGKAGEYRFRNEGPVASRVLAGHTTSPTVVDWDKDGVPDLLVGAEDGFLYYLPNPRATRDQA